ncbi:hypothetical protein BVG16_18305 [Paenibacillus selenitireducens]|jgi:uncharacterized protein (DUF2249 family)|uniref:DUF2249 domain-containing protein n=1 Tax=Paenibacillus selenitireducens TaxID=1324314 RepID=A0A1T2X8L3_9BACL|nr:DUF2249 domain-containing protein [Paenibacillus selenitireducens]OPA76165.1 hypothetical protein BVG16_18305 [Paenibacillus selenitireducens]
MNPYAATVEAPKYPPQLKHKVIFDTFNSLKPTEAMLLVNDHDPVPLRYQFEALYTGKFTWDYIEQGPTTFQVRICKL